MRRRRQARGSAMASAHQSTLVASCGCDHEGHVPKLDQVANKRLALSFDEAVQKAPGGVLKLRFGRLDQVGR